MTKYEIGQILSDQVTTFCGQVQAHIEPEPLDDEAGGGYDPLTRWGDRKFKLKQHDWRD